MERRMPKWTKRRKTLCLIEPLPCQSSSNGYRLTDHVQYTGHCAVWSSNRIFILVLLPILDPDLNSFRISLNVIRVIAPKLYNNIATI